MSNFRESVSAAKPGCGFQVQCQGETQLDTLMTRKSLIAGCMGVGLKDRLSVFEDAEFALVYLWWEMGLSYLGLNIQHVVIWETRAHWGDRICS